MPRGDVSQPAVGVEIGSVFGWLFRKRNTFLIVILLTMIVTVVYYMTLPPYYSAQVSLLPRGGGDVGLLGKLAGLNGMISQSENNLENLYAKIVESNSVLDPLVQTKWYSTVEQDSVFLRDLLSVAEDAIDNDKRDATVKQILRNDLISFHRDFDSGFMTLRVTTRNEPVLSADLANALVAGLDRFNAKVRVEKYRDQRAFIEGRLQAVEASLNNATEDMTRFLERNQSYQSSPIMLQAFNALDRELNAQTAVWVELRRQLELAKIEENKRVMSLDILDRAVIPAKRSGPVILYYLIFGFLGGVTLSLFVIAANGAWGLYRSLLRSK